MWGVGAAWACGCVGRIMGLIGNWARRSLIVGVGREGGGLGGRGVSRICGVFWREDEALE